MSGKLTKAAGCGVGDGRAGPRARGMAMVIALCGAFVIAPAVAPTRAMAQADFRAAIDVPALLKQLDSPVDTVRANAFYSLIWAPSRTGIQADVQTRALLAATPKFARRIRHDLIFLLMRENRRVYAPGAAAMPRLYANYHVDLTKSVGSMNDPAAVQALVGALRTGVADAGILAIGPSAVPQLNIAALAADPAQRAAATRLLARLAAAPAR